MKRMIVRSFVPPRPTMVNNNTGDDAYSFPNGALAYLWAAVDRRIVHNFIGLHFHHLGAAAVASATAAAVVVYFAGLSPRSTEN